MLMSKTRWQCTNTNYYRCAINRRELNKERVLVLMEDDRAFLMKESGRTKTGYELLMAQLLRTTDNSHGWSSLPNPCFSDLLLQT